MIDQQLRGAVVGALSSASENVEAARAADITIRARAYATFTRSGMTAREIRRATGWNRRQLRQAMYGQRFSHNEIVTEVWGAVNLASSMCRHPDRLFSGDIIAAHNIAVRYFPDATYLDTSGAEYVNHRTGERWLLFSQQRWDGKLLTPNPDGLYRGGHYEVWHKSSHGDLSNIDISATLGMHPAATHYKTPGADASRTDGEAFAEVHEALQTYLGCVADDDAWMFELVPHRPWWKRLTGG